jgi:hypothetical protein
MVRRINPGFLTLHSLARIAGTTRWRVSRLIADGIVAPAGTLDFGKKSTAIFKAEDAILVSAKIHPPKSHAMTDNPAAQ